MRTLRLMVGLTLLSFGAAAGADWKGNCGSVAASTASATNAFTAAARALAYTTPADGWQTAGQSILGATVSLTLPPTKVAGLRWRFGCDPRRCALSSRSSGHASMQVRQLTVSAAGVANATITLAPSMAAQSFALPAAFQGQAATAVTLSVSALRCGQVRMLVLVVLVVLVLVALVLLVRVLVLPPVLLLLLFYS